VIGGLRNDRRPGRFPDAKSDRSRKSRSWSGLATKSHAASAPFVGDNRDSIVNAAACTLSRIVAPVGLIVLKDNAGEVKTRSALLSDTSRALSSSLSLSLFLSLSPYSCALYGCRYFGGCSKLRETFHKCCVFRV